MRFLSLFVFALCTLSFAQTADKPAQDANKQNSSQEVDPLKRELTPKQKKEQKDALDREMKFYKKWLDEDVRPGFLVLQVLQSGGRRGRW